MMPRCVIIYALFVALLCGCGNRQARMEKPEDPKGRYHEQITAAKKLLEQKENWAERAEWEVSKTRTGWEVIAWRVEHPEKKGPARYLPWGYSIIQLDSRISAIHYERKG